MAITSAYDMAAMLARHGGTLREYARHYLGDDDATEEEVEAVVGTAVDWLLGQEQPSHEHGMRYATQALYREAQRELHRRALRQAPVDRRLGPLTDAVMAVLDRLGPRSRETIVRIAQGESAEEIARSQNTTLGTVRIRLFRARERALQLMKENGGSFSALLGLLPRRLRLRVTRSLPAVSSSPVGGTFATTALVPVVACSLLWPSGLAPAPQKPTPPVALQEARGAVLAASAPVPGPARAPQPVAGLVEPPRTSTVGGATVPVPLIPRTASQETPDDMLLTAATRAPNYEQTHLVVALGVGRGCQCWAILQSTDGAATWQSAPGPAAGGNQVVLPPTYPQDPRIFIGTTPTGSTSPSWTPAFGDARGFAALGTPPGQLALPAGFDSGDGRVLVAATGAHGGVWAEDLGTGVAAPLLMYPRSALDAAALATPWGDPARGVLVWAPPVSSATGGVAVGSLTSTSLFACPPQAACSTVATLDLTSVGQLVASPAYGRDHVLMAAYGNQAERSVDSGATFRPLPLPAAIAAVVSVASSGENSWVMATLSSGARALWRTAAGAWQAVSATSSMQTHDGELVPLSGSRMLVVLNQAGYRCTVDGGLTWAPRCPADP
ncbi:MAG TPA: sigma factor-like helix-turn-helix DNA-binding protein [Candidatus Dormibacteraeota bacterium]|nr:sigma factor-like helix-turn-helix DNA-binding protein [Candidatus Dormibacteraeota bacterium]